MLLLLKMAWGEACITQGVTVPVTKRGETHRVPRLS